MFWWVNRFRIYFFIFGHQKYSVQNMNGKIQFSWSKFFINHKFCHENRNNSVVAPEIFPVIDRIIPFWVGTEIFCFNCRNFWWNKQSFPEREVILFLHRNHTRQKCSGDKIWLCYDFFISEKHNFSGYAAEQINFVSLM